MNHARVGFGAVGLGDGSVLVVGDDMACYPGGAEPGSELAEVYEPAGDRWVDIESLNKPRKIPATVGLADGSAMVIGGVNSDDVPFSSTKILSPATRTWTDGPLLDVARGVPLAAVLGDGRVLVASVVGADETSARTTTEIYDPEGREWTPGPPLDGPYIDSLVALADGRVLAVGSAFEISLWLEIFDPTGESWTAINPPSHGHVAPQFIALADGGILAVGGFVESAGERELTNLAERYDALNDKWVDVAPMPTARADAALVRLADGTVLVMGGFAGGPDETDLRALTTVEAFDPSTGRWTTGPGLLEPREHGKALVLDDGSVLLMGGDAEFNVQGDTPFCPSPISSVERLAAGAP